jgi:hypothetical protein
MLGHFCKVGSVTSISTRLKLWIWAQAPERAFRGQNHAVHGFVGVLHASTDGRKTGPPYCIYLQQAHLPGLREPKVRRTKGSSNLRFDRSLQGKKSPCRRFLEVLCAKRDKPLKLSGGF